PRIDLVVPTIGTYYLEVSGAGATTGVYEVALTDADPAQLPDLAGTTLHASAPEADFGDAVTLDYTVANPGASTAGAFSATLYVAPSASITACSPALATFPIAGLAPGRSISGTVIVTLPG